jgi:hypothetical protein
MACPKKKSTLEDRHRGRSKMKKGEESRFKPKPNRLAKSSKLVNFADRTVLVLKGRGLRLEKSRLSRNMKSHSRIATKPIMSMKNVMMTIFSNQDWPVSRVKSYFPRNT